MNFSIVLPSIGKKAPLIKMLDSFERTTKNKHKLEILIAFDEGSSKIIREVKSQFYSFNILFFERPKTKDFTNDYYNWMATRSHGDNIMALNDDAWMRTQDWDEKLLRAINESCFSIYCLDIPDTARIKYRNSFPCFPCVSRRSMNTLGFLLCKDVKMYPADKITFSIYQQAERVIPIRNVLIEHEHISESDESKKHMMDAFMEDVATHKGVDVTDYIYKVLLAGQSDCRVMSKFKKIWNIIKER
jgi:hypothetical protein